MTTSFFSTDKRFLITFGCLMTALIFIIAAVSVQTWFYLDAGDSFDTTGGTSHAEIRIGLFNACTYWFKFELSVCYAIPPDCQLNPSISSFPSTVSYTTVKAVNCNGFNQVRAFAIMALVFSVVGLVLAYTVTIRSTPFLFKFFTFCILVVSATFEISCMAQASRLYEKHQLIDGEDFKYGSGFGLLIVSWAFQLAGTICFIIFQRRGVFDVDGGASSSSSSSSSASSSDKSMTTMNHRTSSNASGNSNPTSPASYDNTTGGYKPPSTSPNNPFNDDFGLNA